MSRLGDNSRARGEAMRAEAAELIAFMTALALTQLDAAHAQGAQ